MDDTIACGLAFTKSLRVNPAAINSVLFLRRLIAGGGVRSS